MRGLSSMNDRPRKYLNHIFVQISFQKLKNYQKTTEKANLFFDCSLHHRSVIDVEREGKSELSCRATAHQHSIEEDFKVVRQRAYRVIDK